MKTFCETVELNTKQETELIDITRMMESLVRKSGIKEGQACVYTQHTTSAIVINEREEGLEKDMVLFLNTIVPPRKNYLHDSAPLDGRLNAHSHLQSLLLQASQTIPVIKGALALGSWQKIFFAELDGPRPSRRFLVQILGL